MSSTLDPKLNICVFISGRGSNLKAILEECEKPEFPARVTCVISNKPQAGGLDYAKEYNIPYAVLSHKDYDSKTAYEDALLEALSYEKVDLICLAGFMRLLSPHFLNHWGRYIINIHPSLLPKYKGLDTHKRAIDAGDSEAGCSVHYVIPEMDAGEIIVQRSVKISKKETEDSLAAKVLVEEHEAYKQAIIIVARHKFQDSVDDNYENDVSSTLNRNKNQHKNTLKDAQMADKDAINESQIMCTHFMTAAKYMGGFVTVILILMALFLL